MGEDQAHRYSRRSKIPTYKSEPDARPLHRRRFKVKPRQEQRPPLPPNNTLFDVDGDDSSSDESGLGVDSDSEDEEVQSQPANPFVPGARISTAFRESIASSTSSSKSSSSTAGATSSTLSSFSTSYTQIYPSTTSVEVPASTTGVYSAAETSQVTASPKDNHETAIALGSVLAVLSTATIAFLLYRYCVPVRRRIDRLRSRKEYDPSLNEKAPASRAEDTAAAQPGGFSPMSILRSSMSIFKGAKKSPSPSFTMVPSASTAQATPKSLPLKPSTLPSPLGSHSLPEVPPDQNPDNPFSDHAEALSRSNSKNSVRSAVQSRAPPGYASRESRSEVSRGSQPYAFEFNFSDYRSTQSLPRSLTGSNAGAGTLPVVPLPTGFGTGLGLEDNMTARSPQTPKSAHFELPYAPPSEAPSPRSQYYVPRIRKSITPSESISNAPYSPLPFPAGLRPPLPPNSRWSRNSSSAYTRTVDDRTPTPTRMGAGGRDLPPQLPLAVRTSTSSLDSVSSRGSRRSSGSITTVPTKPASVMERQSTYSSPRTQVKAGATIVGLPSSVKPPPRASR